MSVYRVMKNADFTEGRGPMVYVATFASFNAARSYVMLKGSPYDDRNLELQCYQPGLWSLGGWYEIHEDEVLEGYDANEIANARKELEDLECRVAILRKKVKL